MKSQEIIELIENTPKIFEWSYFLNWWMLFAVVSTLVVFFITYVTREKYNVAIGIAIGNLLFVFFGGYTVYLEGMDEHEIEWKSAVVEYIESQPIEEAKVISFHQLDVPVDDIGPSYFVSPNVIVQHNEVYGEVVYEIDGKKHKENGWFTIEVEKGIDPLYKYQPLKEDLTDLVPSKNYHNWLFLNSENVEIHNQKFKYSAE